jgi:hypothetical protein
VIMNGELIIIIIIIIIIIGKIPLKFNGVSFLPYLYRSPSLFSFPLSLSCLYLIPCFLR